MSIIKTRIGLGAGLRIRASGSPAVQGKAGSKL